MPWSPESYISYLCPLQVRYVRDLCRAKLFFYLFFLLECMGSFFQSIPADRGATHVDAVPQDGRIIPVPSGMAGRRTACAAQDRKSVVSGKGVSVRVYLGGARLM